MKLFRRIIFILIITLVSLFALAVIFISPIAKWAIEKYSVEYTGRQINMDKLYINLFTGNINTKGFKIYEAKSNKLFYQCNEMRIGVTLHKLLTKEYEITEVTLNTPTVYIIQHGKRFNFTDLIKRFSTPPPAKPEPKGAPAHWYVKKFNITNATVIYITDLPANKMQLIHGNIGVSDLAWNNSTYSVKIEFGLASGGTLNATSTFNLDTYLYHVALDIQQFNVKPFYVYLKDYMKVNSLDGLISTQLNISGNMHKATEIATSGKVNVADFSIIDNTNDKLVAFKNMDIIIDSVNTAQNMYKFNTISMLNPYLKFEMYTDGYNFDRLSTTPPSKTVDTSAAVVYANIFQMISGYVQSITQNYVVSNYNADKLSIQNGEVYFTDYTLPQKFTYHFDQLNAVSDRISNNKEKISIVADSRLNSSGHMNGVINVNPNNFKDFDMDFNVKDMHMRDFNPYSKFYVATPFVTGSIQYHNVTTVLNGKLKSSNTLTIFQLKAGKTDDSYKPQYKLPIRLAVALLTDRHGNVTLDIPVAGDLDNPKFKWGKVIWHVLGTLIVKAATAPFRMLANLFGGSEKDYKQLDFEYAQSTLNADQQKQLTQIAKTAIQKPAIKIEMSQTTDANNEKEKIAENLVKQHYLKFGDSLTDDQQQKIASLSVNDSVFVKYIDSILVTPKAQSAQEKCMQIIGPQKLEILFAALEQERNTVVLNFLLQAGAPKDRISIITSPKPFDPSLGDNPKYVINMAVADGTTAAASSDTDKKNN